MDPRLHDEYIYELWDDNPKDEIEFEDDKIMQKDQLKLVFMGTPEFSVKILEGIIDDGYNVIGVITEPDKPVGKKQEILPTPVKSFALSKGIKVHQPATKDELRIMNQELEYDLGVVAAYGKIIPKEVLDKPKYGCINFHGSLLPKLRGASPIQTAILEAAERTGVTIMVMDEGMDTGPILTQVEIPLDDNETTTTLKQKMLNCGLPLLLNTIPGYVDGEIEPSAQGGQATYTKLISKEDGKIDFSKSASEEERKIRAFNEWPGVYCFWNEKRTKVLEAENIQYPISNIPARLASESVAGRQSISNTQYPSYKSGEVFLDTNGDLCVAFSEGYWIIKKLQMEGKIAMSAKDFLNGNKDIIGKTLS